MARKIKIKVKKIRAKKVLKVIRKPRTFAYGLFDYDGKHYSRSYLSSLHGKKAEGYAKQIVAEYEKSNKLHLIKVMKKLTEEEYIYWEGEKAKEMERVEAGERVIL